MTADVNVVIDHSEYTILVVDDVVSNVLLLKVLLTNEKFKVVTANNGKDALVQAAEKQPDLILLDVMMPEMNGFEVSEKLKANPVTQNIPIIFLTALNTTSDIVKGFKVGANDFISKPFNKEELVIRVTSPDFAGGGKKNYSASNGRIAQNNHGARQALFCDCS